MSINRPTTTIERTEKGWKVSVLDKPETMTQEQRVAIATLLGVPAWRVVEVYRPPTGGLIAKLRGGEHRRVR